MNNSIHQSVDPLPEGEQKQRFFAAGRQRLDLGELERLRKLDRETRLRFADMRRRADAFLRTQRS